EAQGRGAEIVVLLELDDDEERRDLRSHRQIPGNEDHRSVLADGARERERETGGERGRDRRQDDAPEGEEAARAERLGRLFEARIDLRERGLHRADDEREAYQRQRDDHADPGVGDLYAERLEPSAEPALRRED